MVVLAEVNFRSGSSVYVLQVKRKSCVPGENKLVNVRESKYACQVTRASYALYNGRIIRLNRYKYVPCYKVMPSSTRGHNIITWYIDLCNCNLFDLRSVS